MLFLNGKGSAYVPESANAQEGEHFFRSSLTNSFEGYTWFASLFKEHFEVTVFAHDEVSSKRKSDALERWKALEGKN
jgi:hypothetical protein